jgi:hypothetical protein
MLNLTVTVSSLPHNATLRRLPASQPLNFPLPVSNKPHLCARPDAGLRPPAVHTFTKQPPLGPPFSLCRRLQFLGTHNSPRTPAPHPALKGKVKAPLEGLVLFESLWQEGK